MREREREIERKRRREREKEREMSDEAGGKTFSLHFSGPSS